jgi:hypothetical protein
MYRKTDHNVNACGRGHPWILTIEAEQKKTGYEQYMNPAWRKRLRGNGQRALLWPSAQSEYHQGSAHKEQPTPRREPVGHILPAMLMERSNGPALM